MSITSHQKEKITSIEGKTSSIMSYCLTQLFFSGDTQGEWYDTRFYGALCFIIDRRVGTNFIKIYDLNDYSVPFEMETPVEFSTIYSTPENNFHCFQLKTGFVGFYFPVESEAATFKRHVFAHAGKLEKDDFEEIKNAILKKEAEKRKVTERLNPNNKRKKEEKKKGILSWFSKKKEPEVMQEEKKEIKITKPKTLERKAHGGYDSEMKKFVIDDIPQEFKDFFKKKGISKKVLEDSEIAPHIFEALNDPNFLQPGAIKASIRVPSKQNNANVPKPPPLPPSNVPKPPPMATGVPKPPKMGANGVPMPPPLPGKGAPPEKKLNYKERMELEKKQKIESGEAEPEEEKPKPKPQVSSGNALLDQIRQGVALRKVQLPDMTRMTKQAENNLGQKLTAIILERRQQITKYDLPEEEGSSDSEWSD